MPETNAFRDQCPSPCSARQRWLRSALAACAVLALSACSYISPSNVTTDRVVTFFSPYRLEVVQGNFLSKEQVDALKPGMTRNQVRDLLGTSLMVSIFHKDRWDYVFTYHRQGEASQSRRLTIFFKDERLDHFEGDPMPTEQEFVATLESRHKFDKPLPLSADPEALKKFAPASPAAARPAPPISASAESYPPLENSEP